MGEPTEAPKPARAWVRWARELAIVAVLIVGVRTYQSLGVASGPAPALDRVDLAGEPVRLGDGERPVLVHFMASWCGVCAAEEGNVAAVARDHEVIAIASQSGAEDEVRRWIETTDLDHVRVIADPRGVLAREWGVRAFPTGFYVDRQGAIETAEVGYTSELGMRLRLWWASL